jgi:polar amino acid transport system substrate-binding protein
MSLKFLKRRQLMGAAAMLGGLPLLASAAGPKALKVVTSHLPPLVIENGGERAGALREIVDELCRRVQLAPQFSFMPWKRAIFVAGITPATAIFPLTRLPEREAQFTWLAPLYEENYIFMAPKGSSFDVRSPLAMKDRRITLIRGSMQTVLLKELGYRKVVEARSVDEVHRFMVEGMADAAIGELGIIKNALRTRKAENEFQLSEPVRQSAAWLAGSRDFTDADAAMFQKAMKELVADGTTVRILKKYSLA